jgi:hypothetical protein
MRDTRRAALVRPCTWLDNLSRIEAMLEQSSDFHEIVSNDVSVPRRAAIHDEVHELRRIIEDTVLSATRLLRLRYARIARDFFLIIER